MPFKSLLPFTAALACLLFAAEPRAQRGGPPVQLPEGTGRDLVQTTCTQCHGLNQITGSWGYTQEGWRELFASMVSLPDDQASAISAYLAKNYPPKPAPEAVVVPGPVSVTIREWVVPTLGSRPHDPLAAPDGSIWWTGQFANRLGRLDPEAAASPSSGSRPSSSSGLRPETGAMKEFPLETPDSGPHGLTADKAGNIWFTGISKNYVGKLDPKTGDVTEYPMPDPKARGPHTPVFDQKGTLWFTLQSGMVGRLVPETGVITIAATPSSGTYPYGIAINSKGVPWYVDFRGNRVGSVDPATMQIREYTLPDPAARPRRIAITPDDAVWYTDYARGYLGRFDPSTGETREWPSPGGRQSQPYGITSVDNVIWYSESAVRPNTIVRFDPATERFQTWTIPSGGGVVRNMMATADGNLVLACSGMNRVALVEIEAGRRP